MTNYNKKLDEIFPDESKDTELQRHLRNVWHDNFSEQEFIDEMEAYITADRKRVALEARIDEAKRIPAILSRLKELEYKQARIAELKAQQEEVK